MADEDGEAAAVEADYSAFTKDPFSEAGDELAGAILSSITEPLPSDKKGVRAFRILI